MSKETCIRDTNGQKKEGTTLETRFLDTYFDLVTLYGGKVARGRIERIAENGHIESSIIIETPLGKNNKIMYKEPFIIKKNETEIYDSGKRPEIVNAREHMKKTRKIALGEILTVKNRLKTVEYVLNIPAVGPTTGMGGEDLKQMKKDAENLRVREKPEPGTFKPKTY